MKTKAKQKQSKATKQTPKAETQAPAKVKVPATILDAVKCVLGLADELADAQKRHADSQVNLGLALRKETSSRSEAKEMLDAAYEKLNKPLTPGIRLQILNFAYPKGNVETLTLALNGDPEGKIKRNDQWVPAAKLKQAERYKVAAGTLIRTKSGFWKPKPSGNTGEPKKGPKAKTPVEKLQKLADSFVDAVVALKVIDGVQLFVALRQALDKTEIKWQTKDALVKLSEE